MAVTSPVVTACRSQFFFSLFNNREFSTDSSPPLTKLHPRLLSFTMSNLKSATMTSSAPPVLNPWESHALECPQNADGGVANKSKWREVQDPVIYPGLYSATGFDMMTILLEVIARPNPKVELGPVDCSVALILCDLQLPDCPIVYASDSFCELTGYSQHDILGRNCRFLQAPRGRNPATYPISGADKVAKHRLNQAVAAQDEIQTQVTNYKKNGQRFTNVLTIIPVTPTTNGYRYAVGFQVEQE
ncbi:putative LOV domain-containing protein [Paramyrothecium foliicola]|nr:putative LOV domain-containing protein [Paramyrothecium foliicola]